MLVFYYRFGILERWSPRVQLPYLEGIPDFVLSGAHSSFLLPSEFIEPDLWPQVSRSHLLILLQGGHGHNAEWMHSVLGGG